VAASPEGQNQQIDLVVHRECRRLLDFIRPRISGPLDAEDVLQDVFRTYANRLHCLFLRG
jgi:DNA-directed RNA polymerase specialized sigma24 family protein